MKKRIKMMKRLMDTCCLIFFFSQLTACGFGLRGQQTLPEQLRILYLQPDAPYDSFTANLRRSLRAQEIKLVESPQQAPLTLVASRPELPDSNMATSQSSLTRVYTLNYAVTFKLINQTGKVVFGPFRLAASRNIIIGQNQVITTNNQMDVSVEGMQKDILDQLYYYLHSNSLRALVPNS